MNAGQIFREECRKGLRETAQRIREQRLPTVYALIRQVLIDHVWTPLSSVLAHLWVKLLAAGPILIWLYQSAWGIEARTRVLDMVQIRWAGHVVITIAIVFDLVTRSAAAMVDSEDTMDPQQWVRTFGKALTFNALVWMLGVLANYGEHVPIPGAGAATLGLLVLFVVLIFVSEFASAARNAGLPRIFSRMIALFQMWKKQEATAEEVEDVTGNPESSTSAD